MFHTSNSSHLLVNANSVRADTLGDVSKGHLALSEDPALLGALLSSSPLGIACIAQNGELLYGNEKLSEIFGRELESENIYGVLADATVGQELIVQDATNAVVKTGQWFGNLRIERPDGSFCNVRNWVTSAAPVSGNFVSIFEDTTSLDVALTQTDHLQSLLEQSDAMALVCDHQGVIQYANPTARRRLGLEGLTETELSLLNNLEVLRLTPESFELMISEVIPALLNSGQWSGETSFVDLQGEIVQTATDAHRNMDKNGRPFYTITIHDVTQFKNIADKLSRQENWFRTMISENPDSIFIVQPPNGILFASPSAETLLGLPLDEIVGKRLIDLINSEDLEGLPLPIREGVEATKSFSSYQLRVKRSDGVDIWCEARSVNLEGDAMINASMVTLRDITHRRMLEEMVIAEARRFTEIVQNLSDGVTIINEDGSIRYQSLQAKRLFGGSGVSDFFEGISNRIHPEDRRNVLGRFTAMLDPRGGSSILIGEAVEFRIKTFDGDWRYCETRVADLRKEPAVGGMVLTTRDVTQARRSERLVTDQAEFLRLVVAGAPLAETLEKLCVLVEGHLSGAKVSVMRVDNGFLSFAAGPSLSDDFVAAMSSVPIGALGGGCGLAAELGETVFCSDVASDPRLDSCREFLAQVGFGAVWSNPVISSAKGEVIATVSAFWPNAHGGREEDVAVLSTAASLCSIAIERKEYETRLSHQAHHDSLTGLPNRALFAEVLSIAVARTKRSGGLNAVLFLDLDRFKNVNDSLGHDAGDEMLVSIAARLRSVARAEDTVARLGGDEFVILCGDLEQNTAQKVAEEVAERALQAISAPMIIRGEVLQISGSIGVSISGPESTSSGLLRDADTAMYRAKDRGKACIEMFGEDLRSSSIRRFEMEYALRRALSNAEFILDYQPVLNLGTGEIEGVEALVRWVHPTRGRLEPGEFVPLAEETGEIREIGAFVLRSACEQLHNWILDGVVDSSFSVSVNVSARQFDSSKLVEVVTSSIAESGLMASQLIIEITEGTLMDPNSIDILKQLHDLGVGVAVDDFGTGYSSLYYLKNFPIDVVKIDRSFVDGLGENSDDEAIVAAVLGLGHALGLKVVAEGVETETHIEHLVALGCDSAQGYLISKPLPPSELKPFINKLS